ncbi:MAG: hypothetical protein RLZZ227_947 [Pseudomonadota bacterium]
MKTRIQILTALLFGLLPALALAHHSFAMFDQTKKVTHTGVVSEVQWTNPHVWIFVDVKKDDGSVEKWGMEFTSKVHLARRNFRSDMVKVGDNVEFTVSPYANGQPGGRFYTIKMANGLYYCDVGAAAQVCVENNPPQ